MSSQVACKPCSTQRPTAQTPSPEPFQAPQEPVAPTPPPQMTSQVVGCCNPCRGQRPGQTQLVPEPDPNSSAPVPSELRPVPGGENAPCYMPQPEDAIPIQPDKEMGPIGPWATGRVDWSPMAGLTGTRPVVDKYSIARYSEGEWRNHNKDILEMCGREQHKMNL